MAGIYIHIPFCKKKCHYCNFFSVATTKNKMEFIKALIKEIELQRNYLDQKEICSVYFGGGTPSLFSVSEIEKIFSHLQKNHKILKTAEITLEANPDDLDSKKIKELSKSFINRLSIGVQSFYDEDLKYLNRIHKSKQAINAINKCQNSGIENISIDLIYGIPTLTNERWIQNLKFFFKMGLPHLSAYSLSIEPKTVLNLLIKKNKTLSIDELQSIQHFEILLSLCEENHFIHYEISNFCKKDYYSKHNSLYWLGKHYLGLGPSAHSYNGKSRQWNVSQLSKYISIPQDNFIIFEQEILSEKQKFNEYIMTSLRTSWGCDAVYIKKKFGEFYLRHFFKTSSEFIHENLIEKKKTIFLLTPKGKIFADRIAAEFFLVE